MEKFEIDAYSPAQMAGRVEKAGITKGNLDFTTMFALAIMAGVFIAFGAVLCTFVITDPPEGMSEGLIKLIGGLVFCIGLILVVVAGAELFTGNNLIIMAYVGKKVTFGQLMRNWVIVFLGNLVGSLIIVYLVYMTGMWTGGKAAVGIKALLIANGKVNLSFSQAFFRGILCNMLVCLAVWLCFSGRSVTDKILAILFPITAFVALGFEHSIANMYFIPAGIVVKGLAPVMQALEAKGSIPDLSSLNIYGFFIKNLLPVTLGNIVGGAAFIGAIYWFVYLRPAAIEPVRQFMTVGPPTIKAGTTVCEAIRIMKESNSGSILVGEPGNAVGIMSEADIIKKLLAEGKECKMVKVEEAMSSPLITIDVKSTLDDVYKKMSDNQIRHLVITEQGKQIGFVSVKDLLKKGKK
ncbi:formate/nitrite transporter family protein [Candidatus Sumerlaeota bacterium]|nr:formate/nitrite transporter family protein [Candidatus Sumerlaeota bacterium]